MLNILAILVGILTATLPQTDTTTTAAAGGGGSGGEIGDPCDPETYSGPYQCLPDENSVSGYAIAN